MFTGYIVPALSSFDLTGHSKHGLTLPVLTIEI